jgi:hypothetical protein
MTSDSTSDVRIYMKAAAPVDRAEVVGVYSPVVG